MSIAPRPDDWRSGICKAIITGIAVDEYTPVRFRFRHRFRPRICLGKSFS